MVFGQTNAGFQVGNTGFNSDFTGGFTGGFTSIPTSVKNTQIKTQKKDDDTYNPRYPGFNEEDYKKLEKMVTDKGVTGREKTQIMDELYQVYYPQVLNKHKLNERQQEINDSVYKNGEILLNGDKEAQMGTKLTQLSQMAKEKFNIPYNTNDNEVIDAMIKGIPNGSQLLYDYVNGKSQDLLYEAGLKERKEETFGQKVADVGVGILQSPGKRGYNMIGQWMDRLGKWGAEQLEGSDLEKWIQDKAIDLFGEDTVREYQKINEMEKAEGKQFNGRTQTDIRTPILGEERAESPYTKGGEIVGDIGSAIALTAPLASATVPAMANSTLGGAITLGSAEGVLDTALSHYGMEGNLDVTPGELGMGALLGGVGGGVTNKLSGLKNVGDKVDEVGTVVKNATKADDVVENASKVEKVVENPKTVAKIEEKTDKAKEYAGRIGQGDIDDQTQVIEGVKTMTRKNGKDKVKDIKKYSDLENMIKDTEKQIVKEENDLLKKYPEKKTDWESEEVVKGLGSQEDVVTRDYIDEGIELLAKYNKNDPAELRRLEMIQEVKDTQGLTLLEAKNLARELTAKLSKKFYNSNDELRNSMSAESYEKIRKGIQNAVRNKLPDDTLKKLDFEYSNLKTFEGLADDMAEKVNALTQKIKKTGPLEKLGRQLGTAINWLSGNSVKGLVEKFLPSNMGNKINNSIDMERELSKNMKKLLKLNEAIDKLNNPTSKTSLKDAAKEFVSIVEDLKQYVSANGVNTTTRGLEAVSEEVFTEN